MTLLHLPAWPLPGMLLSRGNISEHFSRSTCPVRQSSVIIWRALWHKVMLSSVRTLMSLLLSHWTPEEPGGRRFIWAPFYAPQSAACPRETVGMSAASWSISSAQREASGQTRSLRLNNRRLGAGVQPSLHPIAMHTTLRVSELERVSPAGWLVVVMITFFLLMTTEFPTRHRRLVYVSAPVQHMLVCTPFLPSTINRFLFPVTLKKVAYRIRWMDWWSI